MALRRLASAGLVALAAAGCHTPRRQVSDAFVSGTPPPAPAAALGPAGYDIACPDAIELAVPGRPDCSGRFVVAADGRIAVGQAGLVRVEGLTAGQAATAVAAAVGGPAACRVVEHASRFVYVEGPVQGDPRAVPYVGPETVVDLLRRAGGLRPSAALKRISVVRPNVAAGLPPQVIPVDLDAVFLHHDPKANVVVRPNDVIYVGELPRGVVLKYLPHWMRPFYRSASELLPTHCDPRVPPPPD